MANKIRVFISSTMQDLQNERRAVARRLREMNVEPVNAEHFSATSISSWDLIEKEMRQSHLFVLILGSSYGWVPPNGHGAGQGKSVTHLECDLARQLGIPVLAYMKSLAHGMELDPRCEALRKEVSDWGSGVFRAEFHWADDLAERVWESLTGMWTESLLKELVRDRDQGFRSERMSTHAYRPAGGRPAARGSDEWVLLAGAGLSLAAGYPTANILMTAMAQRLWPDIDSSVAIGRHSFGEVAAFFEARLGRAALVNVVKSLLDTPQEVSPTAGHVEAVRKFKTIITTNFDLLFESACAQEAIPFRVITPLTEHADPCPEGVTIYKFSGTISDTESLLLTLDDLQRAMKNDSLFAAACEQLAARRVAVVGHSLHDEHIQHLLRTAVPERDGLYVNPTFSPLDEIVLMQFKLHGRKQTADEFLTAFKP